MKPLLQPNNDYSLLKPNFLLSHKSRCTLQNNWIDLTANAEKNFSLNYSVLEIYTLVAINPLEPKMLIVPSRDDQGPFSYPRANVPGPYQALGVSTQMLAFL